MNNPNKQTPKTERSTKIKRGAAALLLAAGGIGIGAKVASMNSESAKSPVPTTEAPALASTTTTSPESALEASSEIVTKKFIPEVESFIQAMTDDKTGTVERAILAPNGEDPEIKTQYTYYAKKDGIVMSINAYSSSSDSTLTSPAAGTIVEFTAEQYIPHGAQPTSDNPEGNKYLATINASLRHGNGSIAHLSGQMGEELYSSQPIPGQPSSTPDEAVDKASQILQSFEQFVAA